MSNTLPFPTGFIFGAATAAYQIEGAWHDDGKGESIWDRFCHTPGAIDNGDTGDVACDHYHRWREDVALMQRLGLKAYRFSIAWPRVLPAGRGAGQRGRPGLLRPAGGRAAGGRHPARVTLYHWDLPQALQDRGGWPNRDTADWFADYAAWLSTRLGDRVKHWMTQNEPWVAPFRATSSACTRPGQDLRLALRAGHHLLLAHGLAVEPFRATLRQDARVGITLDLHPSIRRATGGRRGGAALRRLHQPLVPRPGVQGPYPEDMLELATGRNGPQPAAGDLAPIAGRSTFWA